MSGRIAIITGAGSGIGRAVSIALSRRGYRLGLAGRRSDALSETSALLALGCEHLSLQTDVTQEASVESLFAAVVAKFGRIDLLFNNAGTSAPETKLEDLSLEAWRCVIDTNLSGAFLCLRTAFRTMKTQTPRGGRIINNGSVSAIAPRPHSAPYTVSKHGMTGLTKSASLDGRAYDIACCQIDIGNASSVMGDRMASGVLQANGTIAKEPVMDVAHVGEAICFMDSLPLEANVPSMTLLATTMPFIGRG